MPVNRDTSADSARVEEKEKLSANHLVWNTPTGERLGLGIRIMTDIVDSGPPSHDAENPAAP